MQRSIRLLQELVRDHSGALLLGFACAGAVAGIAGREARVDFRIESLMRAGDPELLRNRWLEQRFGNDEVLTLAFELGHPFTSGDLRALAVLSDRIAAIEGVLEVIDLSTVEDVRSRGGAIDASPLLDRERLAHADDGGLEGLWERVFGHRLYDRLLVSPALDVLAMRILQAPADPEHPQRSQQVVAAVHRVLADAAPRWQVHAVGPPETEFLADSLLRIDLASLGVLALLLLLAVVAAATRRAAALLSIAALVAFSELMLFGWFGISGTPITLVTELAPAILIAPVAISGIHALGLLQQLGPAERPAWALIERLCAPALVASASNGIGFLSLRWVGVPALSDLGTALGAGIAAACAASLLGLPAWVERFGNPARAVPATGWMQRAAGLGLRFARRPLLTLGIAALLIGASIAGCLRLELEADPLRYFRPDHPHVVGSNLVARELAGTRVLSVAIETQQPGGALEPEVLRLAATLIREARASGSSPRSSSLLDHLWLLDAALRPGEPPREILPSRELAAEVLRLYAAGGDIGDLRHVIDADRSSLQLLLSLDTTSSVRILELRDRLLQTAAEIPGAPRVEVLGHAVLFSKISHAIVHGTTRGLALALLCSGLALALSLRSLRLAALALVANAIPIAVCAGALGWAGIPLSLGTSLLGCAVLGLSVAASAHVFAQLDRRRGLRLCYARVALPLMLAGIALCTGFGALAFSQFQTLALLGLVGVLTSITALACLLWLLPSLLVLAGHPLDAEGGERR